MRRVIGFLGSLGVGVMLAAAGLTFDVMTLFYGGIVILALMAALWIYDWSRPTMVPAQAALENGYPPASSTDPKDKVVRALMEARREAMIARSVGGGEEACRRAIHEIDAALLSANQQFGIPQMSVSAGSYKDILAFYIGYIDAFLPNLREGHVKAAQTRAKNFKG